MVSVVASFLFDASPAVVVAKIAAVALLIGIAGYAAGQSGQHRRREQRAKRLYLELTAFGPFAEPLQPRKNSKRVRTSSNAFSLAIPATITTLPRRATSVRSNCLPSRR